ncbi:DNA repair protein XRCC2 isoform X2 [Molossus molossus]|uniref:DNA repair protein XRCC2 isoform X2 n=1 Tax=Molossus molossus TaxID=27622 RepID=UPI001746FD0E|nr:DNA repair protein XRCC2 isoform X2 [Molossus molossus]
MCSDFHKAESGTELLARLEGRRSLKEIEPRLFADEDSAMHGAVLEFHGPEGTGKTEMLYHIAARCILPRAEGGLQVEVLFIDTDYHFDMLRLVTVLEHRLPRSSEEAVTRCLGRLFLARCSSSSQLLLTLHALEALFCRRPSLRLLILDSVSAFYWVDRASGGESVHLQESTLKKCSQFLEKLVNEYRLAVFATTQSLMRKSPSPTEGPPPASGPPAAGGDFRPYLCKAWQQLITQRILQRN